MSRWIVALIFLVISFPAGASAALLKLEYSGTFSSSSTLGGVAFGADTPFTYSAVFDSLTDTVGANGQGVFDAVVTFDIPGIGTFVSDLTGDVNVALFDPSSGGDLGAFLSNSSTSLGFGGLFSTATPVFDADTPIPSVLTGFLGPDDGLPFTIPLSGGAGDLVVFGVVSGASAQISQVPIPSAFLLFGTGLASLVGWRKWSR